MDSVIKEICDTFRELKRLEREMGLTPKYVITVPLSGIDLGTWANMLNYGASEIMNSERQLKQIYTNSINEGMAFGL